MTGQRTGRKPEPETTTLLSALERVHWGQKQSQTLKGKGKKRKIQEEK